MLKTRQSPNWIPQLTAVKAVFYIARLIGQLIVKCGRYSEQFVEENTVERMRAGRAICRPAKVVTAGRGKFSRFGEIWGNFNIPVGKFCNFTIGRNPYFPVLGIHHFLIG